MEIPEGTSADDVLELLGRPRFTKIVGDVGVDKVTLPDGEVVDVKRLLVEWHYESVVVSLARREGLYRVTGVKPKVGRNAPCPCGSGKKYKHCCLGGRNE